jgi:hypothetical protein
MSSQLQDDYDDSIDAECYQVSTCEAIDDLIQVYHDLPLPMPQCHAEPTQSAIIDASNDSTCHSDRSTSRNVNLDGNNDDDDSLLAHELVASGSNVHGLGDPCVTDGHRNPLDDLSEDDGSVVDDQEHVEQLITSQTLDYAALEMPISYAFDTQLDEDIEDICTERKDQRHAQPYQPRQHHQHQRQHHQSLSLSPPEEEQELSLSAPDPSVAQCSTFAVPAIPKHHQQGQPESERQQQEQQQTLVDFQDGQSDDWLERSQSPEIFKQDSFAIPEIRRGTELGIDATANADGVDSDAHEEVEATQADATEEEETLADKPDPQEQIPENLPPFTAVRSVSSSSSDVPSDSQVFVDPDYLYAHRHGSMPSVVSNRKMTAKSKEVLSTASRSVSESNPGHSSGWRSRLQPKTPSPAQTETSKHRPLSKKRKKPTANPTTKRRAIVTPPRTRMQPKQLTKPTQRAKARSDMSTSRIQKNSGALKQATLFKYMSQPAVPSKKGSRVRRIGAEKKRRTSSDSIGRMCVSQPTPRSIRDSGGSCSLGDSFASSLGPEDGSSIVDVEEAYINPQQRHGSHPKQIRFAIDGEAAAAPLEISHGFVAVPAVRKSVVLDQQRVSDTNTGPDEDDDEDYHCGGDGDDQHEWSQVF